MAKIDLKFLDNYGGYISVKKTNYDPPESYEDGIAPTDEIYITGYDEDNDSYFEIQLDKSTAIKFAKTLRTEINKIQ